MAGVNAMLAQARKSLGLVGRPNYITRWYGNARGHGSYFLSAPWCDMSISYWAFKSGNHAAVCPKGDRAYTVWHAEDFGRLGQGWAGTTDGCRKAKPGDIVFFDWNGSNGTGPIDHVGIVERNLGGGVLQTIEGNTGDACRRRVRDSSTVAYLGRPKYTAGPPPKPDFWVVKLKSGKSQTVPWATPYLRSGSEGQRVKWLQQSLNIGVGAKLATDGEYGPKTKAAVTTYQKTHKDEHGRKLEVDGVYGHHTARSLVAVVRTK